MTTVGDLLDALEDMDRDKELVIDSASHLEYGEIDVFQGPRHVYLEYGDYQENYE